MFSSGGNGEPPDGKAAFITSAIDGGALLKPGKLPFGMVCVAVDLPASAVFTAQAFMPDETIHILRRIAQKQADFMGKGGTRFNSLFQKIQIIPKIFAGIPRLN